VLIHLESLRAGAARARGTTIVIDVFRAFTTAAVALARGARQIVLTAEVEDALALRRAGVVDLCMGEVGGARPDGFDFGNSPDELTSADVVGRTIAQSTRAGTVGICTVPRGVPIYAASLLTARATALAVRAAAPSDVTIVAMGLEGRERSDEDELCAMYIRNLLEGRQPDRIAVAALVRAGKEAGKFGDPARPHFRREDLEIAVRIDTYDFAVPVSREDGLLVARRSPAVAP
jgi:2-phosphosulfolactate phosphatase